MNILVIQIQISIQGPWVHISLFKKVLFITKLTYLDGVEVSERQRPLVVSIPMFVLSIQKQVRIVLHT